jgi:hypothetical protein
VPAETGVVEIDELQPAVLDEDILRQQVSVDQAVILRAPAVRGEPPPRLVPRLQKQLRLRPPQRL